MKMSAKFLSYLEKLNWKQLEWISFMYPQVQLLLLQFLYIIMTVVICFVYSSVIYYLLNRKKLKMSN